MRKLFLFLFIVLQIYSCKKIDVYEKRIAIPNFKWEKKFTPTFQFENTISNNTNYLFAIIRHTNNYPYNNIWIKLTITSSKDSTSQTKEFNIPLTKNNQNKEWANDGMDDIYEIKYPLVPFAGAVGDYTFKIENLMRDNPLPEILNVGLRIERKMNP